ncbi:putative flippase GtrA [Anseongella ginsenosidimutans]|uniref:Putative flippase GtrA n=1 Tax=Anseongella ginsenosidimutans TaxID=496056 RepID=A0A4R3KKR2_9SPHI|nr:GtrA family protein [Anseongella ginsenosidimutans]TCS84257.1 putative flippase GtrA [Anseongella ginsenosidimutans]
MLCDFKTVKEKQLVYKLFKFCATGFMGLLIDFSITWLFKDLFGMDRYLANATGFVIAASCNFYINKKWTFNDKSKQVAKQYFSFFAISTVGLVLNTLILFLFHQKIGIAFYLSKALAIVLVSVWNFSANLWLTFNSKT